ncbi:MULTISPECIES: glycosyltransferase family 2 protein [Levilactobacillus]|uniref:glycosyltransferase family 2 protein n=1 Tax=Levilactobacillus TaxID=2767886 RepID=UPI0021A2ED08|nr:MULTISPECIES: glycosyltransferase [Levilactobacillus]MCT3584276.1 glycosyltransferase [Levilactobacillus brevis]MCT4488814.1 glycosyltransferase [Levilactobacillus parabrevis]MCT4491344.1 glycosyltransferase [Levilactobacillus parabrevis]
MRISVVVPIYNVEKYLEKAVISLLKQTLSDIEIILVDDGSTDRSGELADKVGERDGRIRVIHKDNGGAPSARNLGMSVANGKYIYFMDPDDVVRPKMLEEMFVKAEKDHAQMVISGFTNQYFENGRSFQTIVKPKEKTYMTKVKFRECAYKYFNDTLIAVPWNKLYLVSYLKAHNLKFPNVKWDDLHFNMEVIRDISRVSVIDNTDYQFLRSRPGSETTTVFNKSLIDIRKQQFEHVLDVYSYWQNVTEESWGAIYYYYASRLVQCIQELTSSPNLSWSEKKKITKRIINDDLSRQAISSAVGASKLMSLCFIPMRLQLVNLTMIMGSFISFFKNNMSGLFYQLKLGVMRSKEE